MLRMLLHEGLLGPVLLLGQGLVSVPEQPRQKYAPKAEQLGVRVGRWRGFGVVVGVVVVHHFGGRTTWTTRKGKA